MDLLGAAARCYWSALVAAKLGMRSWVGVGSGCCYSLVTRCFVPTHCGYRSGEVSHSEPSYTLVSSDSRALVAAIGVGPPAL